MDELDRQLLTRLQEDARRSHRRLARMVGSTQPTVTARIRRMEDAGLIKGYTVRLDDAAFTTPDGPIQVACHWCKRRSSDPVWRTVDGRKHSFCCTTCRSAYQEKHASLREGL